MKRYRGKLDEEARTALAYLRKQAGWGHTCYPRFHAEGLEVIGSRQIEGANTSVIGSRLNLSGARWSEEGAQGMVFVRAAYYSHRALTDFHPPELPDPVAVSWDTPFSKPSISQLHFS